MAEPFVHHLRVRYSECDSQGVLFNANYLAWIDHTVTEMWRAAYGGYQTMLDRGVDIVVAEVRMRFLGSARFDEEVELEAVVTNLGTTSVTSAHRFRRVGDGAGGGDRAGGDRGGDAGGGDAGGGDAGGGDRGGGELLLDAEIRHVFVDPETAVKTPMPDWARAGLEQWYLPAAAG
jgi:acyl-CoA thioester hydrolase